MSDSDTDDDVYGEQADEAWEEWDGAEDEEDDAAKSLFSDTVLPNPEAAFDYDAQHFGFDIRQYRIERDLDDYDMIKFINYIRREVSAGRDPLPALLSFPKCNKSSDAPWYSDDYLNPVVLDDPLITYDYDEGEAALAAAMAAASAESSSRSQGKASSSSAAAAAAQPAAATAGLQQQVMHLSAENSELKLRIAALMDAALPADVRQELRSEAAAAAAAEPSYASSPAAAAPTAAVAASGSRSIAVVFGSAGRPANLRAGIDKQYFDSYSYFDIHQEMLADKPRTESYKIALTQNPSLIRGARVLDVGCGTGILSMFAAEGGAAAVVGLDGSERIAGFARQVVAANHLDTASGGPVNIVAGKVEETNDIGHDKVDVIVSEWMGYALLFESMLDSVLAARDKWLKPGGAVLPDIARIYVAGANSEALGTSFWQDVYGFTMAPIAAELQSAAAKESKVLVKPADSSSITTNTVTAHTLDLATMQPHHQDFTTQFELTAASSSSSSSSDIAALVIWFDTEFSPRYCRDTPVTLSTGPHQPVTHWAQAVLPLQQPVMLFSEQSDRHNKLLCRLSMAKSRSRHRSLDISLEYTCAGGGEQGSDVKATRVYTIEVSSTD